MSSTQVMVKKIDELRARYYEGLPGKESLIVLLGDSNPHNNDGSIFKNREGLLPKNPDGYYREYVHPTPGIRGPGPQRIIMGRGGETYFTPDHYKSFRRIDYYYYRESHFN